MNFEQHDVLCLKQFSEADLNIVHDADTAP